MVALNPDVQEIVGLYLKEHGYTGLFYPDDECGCTLEDLATCGEMRMECEAGYKVMCKPEDCRKDEIDGCPIDCLGYTEDRWVVYRTKEGR